MGRIVAKMFREDDVDVIVSNVSFDVNLLRISGRSWHGGGVVKDDFDGRVGPIRSGNAGCAFGIETGNVAAMCGNINGPAKRPNEFVIEAASLFVAHNFDLFVLSFGNIKHADFDGFATGSEIELREFTFEFGSKLKEGYALALIKVKKPKMCKKETTKMILIIRYRRQSGMHIPIVGWRKRTRSESGSNKFLLG